MRKRQLAGQKPEGKDRFEGFTIDLLERLAAELKFHYQLYVSPSNAYGGPKPDGSWDGMVGEILNGVCLLLINSLCVSNCILWTASLAK